MIKDTYLESMVILQFLLAVIEIVLLYSFISPLRKLYVNIYKNISIVILASIILTIEQCLWLNIYIDMIFRCIIIFFTIMILCKTTIKHSLYLSICFYIATDICRSLISESFLNIFNIYIFQSKISPIIYTITLTLLKVLIVSIVKKYIYRNNKENISLRQLCFLLLPFIPFIYIRSIQYKASYSLIPLSSEIVIIIILLSVCDLAMIIIFETILSNERNKNDLLAMELLLKTQNQQYINKLDNINKINKIYHDMKKHFTYIKSINTNSSINSYIDSIYSDIQSFKIIEHTGNEALDIVLNEKLTYCNKNNIRFIPYINGSVINFMNPIDICILFGNAIDNAIEAINNVTDYDKREISLKVSEKNNFVTVYISNYYNHTLKLSDENQFITTKDKNNFHGYGLSNIKNIVNKYNGEISISTEDNLFVLTLFLNKSC